MKNKLFLFLFLCFSFWSGIAQNHKQEILKFQKDLNEEFLNPKESPLTKKDIGIFKSHNFYSIQENYRVEAKFERKKKPIFYQIKQTDNQYGDYDLYGKLTFKLNGKTYKLNVYQSHKLRNTEAYKDYLFLPFTDETNGNETYGGGRYIDLSIPESDSETMIIDFNKAYSPSCAYNHRYSCPIPPSENHLKIRIEAGVKNLKL